MANTILLYVVALTGATTLVLKFFKLIDRIEEIPHPMRTGR